MDDSGYGVHHSTSHCLFFICGPLFLSLSLPLSIRPSARPACEVFQLFLSRSGVVVVVVLFMSSLAPFYFNSITIHLFLF